MNRYIPFKLPKISGIYDKETGEVLKLNSKEIDLYFEILQNLLSKSF